LIQKGQYEENKTKNYKIFLEYFNIKFQDTLHQLKTCVPYQNTINVCTMYQFYCLSILFKNSFSKQLLIHILRITSLL